MLFALLAEAIRLCIALTIYLVSGRNTPLPVSTRGRSRAQRDISGLSSCVSGYELSCSGEWKRRWYSYTCRWQGQSSMWPNISSTIVVLYVYLRMHDSLEREVCVNDCVSLCEISRCRRHIQKLQGATEIRLTSAYLSTFSPMTGVCRKCYVISFQNICICSTLDYLPWPNVCEYEYIFNQTVFLYGMLLKTTF
jgi:hypothetical protein